MKRSLAWCSIAVLALALSPAAFSAPEFTADQFTLKLVSGNPSNGPANYAPVLTPIPETDGSFHGFGAFWDLSYNLDSTNCLSGCQLVALDGPTATLPDVMEINFSKVVGSATIVIDADDTENATLVEAFNSAGQMIADCGAVGGDARSVALSVPGCVVSVLGSPPQTQEFNVNEQITITAPGIAHLLAGEENAGADPVTFNVPKASGVPEPGTLALFAVGVLGLGLVRRCRN